MTASSWSGERRELLARVRFVLARALWAARGERARALALAQQAREGLAAGPAPGEALQEVVAWIASHRE